MEMEVEDILHLYKNTKESWASIFDDFVEDSNFANGDQWDDKTKKARENENLACVTYNNIPPAVKYIVNNARNNTPSIKTNPINDGDTNTAKIIDGIIKDIQYKSNAKQAYINALTNAVIGGIGAWRVNIVDNDEDGDIDISIDRILDPTSILIDTNSQKQDFSDARYCFISNYMSKDDFKIAFPEQDPDSFSKNSDSKFLKNTIEVIEYWCKNIETGKFEIFYIAGDKIIGENLNYFGKYLPICFLTGEEKQIKGKREYKGIVRDIKDMQKLVNLYKSRTADFLSRSANQPWLFTAKMIEGYEDIWMTSNINGAPGLPYNDDKGAKPERMPAPEPPVGFMQASQESQNDIRNSLGIKDTNADFNANISSKTLAMQLSQSNIASFNFIDNLNELIKYTGKIIVDLIPHVYNYPHVRQIMGIDDQITTIPIQTPYEENNEVIFHDLSKGKYIVTLTTGPSYQSQKEEAVDKILEYAKIDPSIMQIAGDLLFKNLDFDGAQDIAARIRATISPNILGASNPTNDDKVAIQNMANQQAQLQAQLQQLQAQNQQLQQIIQQMNFEKAAKVTEIQERGKVDLALKQIELQGKSQLLNQEAQIDGKFIQDKHQNKIESDMLKNRTEIFKKQLDHTHTININDNQLRMF